MFKKSGIINVLVIIAWSCTGHIRQALTIRVQLLCTYTNIIKEYP